MPGKENVAGATKDEVVSFQATVSAHDSGIVWLDEAHDAIFIHDIAGKIRYWNHGAEILYGWSKEQVRGVNANELLHTILPVPLANIVEEMRQNGKWEGELCHTTNGGATLAVSSHWSFCHSDGAPAEILEFNRDITEQKRLEAGFRGINQELELLIADLRRAKELFRGLLESAPDAMVIVRPDGEIALVNEQTQKQFGYRAEELLGRKVEILMPERFRTLHLAERGAYTRNAHVRPMGAVPELYGLRKNGEEFPVEISLSPLMTTEGLLISSSIRDITERRQVENQLRDKIKELERELLEQNRGQTTSDRSLGASS